jgi:hypothetical protein
VYLNVSYSYLFHQVIDYSPNLVLLTSFSLDYVPLKRFATILSVSDIMKTSTEFSQFTSLNITKQPSNKSFLLYLNVLYPVFTLNESFLRITLFLNEPCSLNVIKYKEKVKLQRPVKILTHFSVSAALKAFNNP